MFQILYAHFIYVYILFHLFAILFCLCAFYSICNIAFYFLCAMLVFVSCKVLYLYSLCFFLYSFNCMPFLYNWGPDSPMNSDGVIDTAGSWCRVVERHLNIDTRTFVASTVEVTRLDSHRHYLSNKFHFRLEWFRKYKLLWSV